MKFEAEKGSILWQLWADLFLLWKDHGNIHSIGDRADWATAAYIVCEKYENTEEWDLCAAQIGGMMRVITERLAKEGVIDVG